MLRGLLLGLALIGLVLGGYAVWRSAFTTAPAVTAVVVLSPAELERGRRIHRQLFPAGPTLLPERQLRLSREDIELGLNYLLASRQWGYGRVHLSEQALRLDLSLRAEPLRRYLNLELHLVPQAKRLTLDQLRLGVLPVPGGLARPLLTGLLTATPFGAELRLLPAVVRSARLTAGELQLTLDWDRDSVQALIDSAGRHLAGIDPAQLAAYRARLGELARVRPALDFPAIMGELFALAQARSRAGDPVAENRALLIALAEAANGRRLGLPQGEGPRLRGLNLGGRRDYVQHFTLSAALAAVLGEDLADQAGLYKEVRDTRGGSGFSFSDLAADRAGSHFGMRATASPRAARRLQDIVADSRDSTLYMPEVSDLPEFLPLAEFERRYGGVGGAGYQRLLAEIERRISALPVHRRGL